MRKESFMDKMYIKGLVLKCIIGTKPEERRIKQRVVVDVVLHCDLRRVGRTDKLDDTVNYKKLSDSIA